MLGHRAKDKITGLKGIITAVAEFKHAPPRIELTPDRLSDGKPMDPLWLDEARLDVGKVAVKVSKPEPTVQMGDEVADSLTGFKGIATGRFTFLNGCLRVEVTPTALKDGKPIDPHSFDEQRLTVAGKPVKSKAETGGPFNSPPARQTPK